LTTKESIVSSRIFSGPPCMLALNLKSISKTFNLCVYKNRIAELRNFKVKLELGFFSFCFHLS